MIVNDNNIYFYMTKILVLYIKDSHAGVFTNIYTFNLNTIIILNTQMAKYFFQRILNDGKVNYTSCVLIWYIRAREENKK